MRCSGQGYAAGRRTDLRIAARLWAAMRRLRVRALVYMLAAATGPGLDLRRPAHASARPPSKSTGLGRARVLTVQAGRGRPFCMAGTDDVSGDPTRPSYGASPRAVPLFGALILVTGTLPPHPTLRGLLP